MSDEPPRVPRSFYIAAALVWLALLVAGALTKVAGDVWWLDVVRDLLAAGAAGIGAVVIGANTLERWQRRAWRSRNERLAFHALQQMTRQLKLLAANSVEILVGPGPESSEVAEAIGLPWSDERERRIKAVELSLRGHVDAMFGPTVPSLGEDGSESQRAAALRLRERARELEDRADRLVRLAADLTPFLDHDEARRLRYGVVNVHERVVRLIDPMPGVAYGDAFRAMFIMATAKGVLDQAPDICSEMSAAFSVLEDGAKDSELRLELDRQRVAASEEDRASAEEFRLDQEHEKTLREFDDALKAFTDEGESALASVREFLESDVAAEQHAGKRALESMDEGLRALGASGREP